MSLSESSGDEELFQASKDGVIGEVEGDIEKDVSHLNYQGDVEVKCMGCDKTLLVLAKVEGKPPMRFRDKVYNKHTFKANCPHCSSDSWTTKVEGTYMMGPADGVVVADVSTSILDNDVVLNAVVLKKA